MHSDEKCVRLCMCGLQRSAENGQQMFHPQGNGKEGKTFCPPGCHGSKKQTAPSSSNLR